jgi:hypothetical protein
VRLSQRSLKVGENAGRILRISHYCDQFTPLLTIPAEGNVLSEVDREGASITRPMNVRIQPTSAPWKAGRCASSNAVSEKPTKRTGSLP